MLPVPAAIWAAVGSVADVVPTAALMLLGAALGVKVIWPQTSQSPGLRLKVARLSAAAVVRAVAVAWLADRNSPILPAAALEASVTPFRATVFGTCSLASVPSLARLPASALTAVGPAGPVAPVAPAVPAWPSAPVAPGSPAGPCAPAAPASPFGPFAPCAPVSPTGPCAPVSPAGPAGPGTVLSAPEGPCGPGTVLSAPGGPALPGGPTFPGGPCGPGGPCAGAPSRSAYAPVAATLARPRLPCATVPMPVAAVTSASVVMICPVRVLKLATPATPPTPACTPHFTPSQM